MTEDDLQSVAFRLVQIGATCDHAQPKNGSLIYLLGFEWRFKNHDGSKHSPSKLYAKKQKKSGLEWRSPVLSLGEEREPGCLSVFLNCSYSIPREATKTWSPKMRLREDLISKLTQEFSRHISRPGIVTLSPDI